MDVNGISRRRPVKLAMTRGDTEHITIKLKGYTPSTGDKVELTVRKTPDSTSALIHKTVTTCNNGAYVIDIAASDTASLTPDVYVYDIQLTINGEIKTIIPVSQFRLLEEVTY